MRLFYCYSPPRTKTSDPAQILQSLVILKQGLSWRGLVFGLFWLLYRRLWFWFFVAILAIGIAQQLVFFYNLQADVIIWFILFIHLLIGFESEELLQDNLHNSGWLNNGVFLAHDRNHAYALASQKLIDTMPPSFQPSIIS